MRSASSLEPQVLKTTILSVIQSRLDVTMISHTSMKISVVKTVYAFIVLCGIVYAFVALRGPNGIPALMDKRRQVQEFEVGNEQLHREIEQKQGRIQRLQNDPREQEIEI